jgi:DNA polymerase-4
MDKIKNRFGYDAVSRCGGKNITSKAGNIISNPKAQYKNQNPDNK